MTATLPPATSGFDPELWAPDESDWTRAATEATAKRPSRADRIRAYTYRRSQLDQIPPPSYLIDGVLNTNVLALLAGKFGTYKSFVSVSFACSIATGQPWLGHDITQPGPVIYVAAEGASGLRARISAWESVYNRGARVPDDRLVVVGCSVNLTREDEVVAIDELCADVRPRMVIWDTLHRCTSGV